MTISSCSYLLASLSMGALITGCSIGFIGSVYIKWVFNDKIQVINTSFISGFIVKWHNIYRLGLQLRL